MLMAMGGYGDMGMMGGSTAGTGLIDSLKTKLSFLPEWAAILVIAVLVILAAMLVGWIGGKIIGSILYPDPDKQSILSKKQKFMVLGGAIAAIALTIFALTYTPAPDTGDDALPTGENVSMDGMDGMDGMEGTDARPRQNNSATRTSHRTPASWPAYTGHYHTTGPVSYTHLDVYKRQPRRCPVWWQRGPSSGPACPWDSRDRGPS